MSRTLAPSDPTRYAIGPVDALTRNEPWPDDVDHCLCGHAKHRATGARPLGTCPTLACGCQFNRPDLRGDDRG